MATYLQELVTAQKSGKAMGIISICSANPFFIRAGLEHARDRDRFVCIDSTGRQVNPDGGYAGLTPEAFARYIRQTAGSVRLDGKKIILGGDHLGPGAWSFENFDTAMAKARELTRQCVYAGYQKLHLDPSMPCKNDIKDGRPYLCLETIADRTALLCETAEAAAANDPIRKNRLIYVVGAEVPTPGGVVKGKNNIRVSSARDVEETIRTMRRAFIRKGLEDAWHRCIAVVVETGATFAPEAVYDYDSAKVRDLKLFIQNEKNLVLEAHSTDFQTRQALTDMVRDHFAILKVAPCLTFAAREALFALSYIEREWLGRRKGVRLSQLPDLMKKLMHTDQKHWQTHYTGDAAYLKYITAFGFSDRIRYYWAHPR